MSRAARRALWVIVTRAGCHWFERLDGDRVEVRASGAAGMSSTWTVPGSLDSLIDQCAMEISRSRRAGRILVARLRGPAEQNRPEVSWPLVSLTSARIAP